MSRDPREREAAATGEAGSHVTRSQRAGLAVGWLVASVTVPRRVKGIVQVPRGPTRDRGTIRPGAGSARRHSAQPSASARSRENAPTFYEFQGDEVAIFIGRRKKTETRAESQAL